MMIIDFPRRGEIWLTRLDPTVGSEIKKTRPAVIISNNTANRCSDLVTVMPISKRGEKVFAYQAGLPEDTLGLTKPSKVQCNQIRAIDKSRLLKLIGYVDYQSLLSAEEALKLHLDLP